MKRYSLIFSALLLIFTASPALAGAEVGQPAPDFEAVDTNGQPFRLSDHKGKTLVLEWTNHECPFVKKHYGTGNMQRIQKEARAMGDVEWVSIVSSAPGRQGHITPEESMEIVKEQGADPAFKILDEEGTVGKLYGALSTPHMFVIDTQGVVAYAGAIDDQPSPNPATVEGAKNYVLAALEDLKAGRSVAVPQTQPYGCGVKY